MKLNKILNEVPLSAGQEEEFLSNIKQQIQSNKGQWPSQKWMKSQLKTLAPGTKQLGRGAFSIAHGKKGSDVVVKISLTNADAEATLEYLQWSKQLKNNPYVPKVYNVTSPHRSEGKYGENVHVYARIERLNPLRPSKYQWKEEHIPFLRWMRARNRLDAFVPSHPIVKFLRKHEKTPTDENNLLLRTIKTINQMAGGHLDLALTDPIAHNIMVRPSTNEIVISDPY